MDFLNAVSRGTVEEVQQFIDEGYDMDIENEYGQSLLHLAVERSDVQIARILINNGADVDAVDDDHLTPLYCAVDMDDFPMIELLMNSEADPDIEDNNGQTPIFVTLNNGNLQILTYLIDHDANVHYTDADGRNLLFWAVLQRSRPIVEYLLTEELIDINQPTTTTLDTPLMAACNFVNLADGMAFANVLLQYGANPNLTNRKGQTALCILIERSPHADFVKLLLKNRADPNILPVNRESVLYVAVTRLQVESVKLLLAYGADPNVKNLRGKSALDRALTSLDSNIPLAFYAHFYQNRSWVFDEEIYNTLPLEMRLKIGLLDQLWRIGTDNQGNIVSTLPTEVLFNIFKQIMIEYNNVQRY
jgi:ankyrin repeat protein